MDLFWVQISAARGGLGGTLETPLYSTSLNQIYYPNILRIARPRPNLNI